ncbi:MAG: hypothetical protein ACQKBY_06005 [Verrucomicrobiales bacterium]
MTLINGNPPAHYGVSVASRRYRSGNADELRLDVVRQSATGAVSGLAYGDSVTLTKDGTTLFKGTVREVPRAESGDSAGQQIVARGPFDALERLVFQRGVQRFKEWNEAADPREPVYETIYTSHFTQGRDGETTGERIEEALNYGAAQSGAFQVGAVASGVPWTPTEVKDQTCADAIRHMMGLNPELVMTTNYTTNPPTISVVSGGSSTVSASVVGCASYDVSALDGQACDEVVIRHEHVTQDGADYYFATTEDKAFVSPATGDGTSENAYVRTIGLEPGGVQWETASVGLDPIEQAGGTEGDIAEWWVRKDERLRAVNERVVQANPGLDGVLAGLLKVPTTADEENDIVPHTVTVTGAEERENIFGEKVAASVDPEDYPNELTGGHLPEWADKRYRQLTIESTLGITQSDLDSISSATLKGALKKIFTVEKEFGGTEYLVSKFTYSCMGTNAEKERFRRPASYEPAETLPLGLASALLASYSKTRHTGSITFVDQEPRETYKVGQALNLTDGETAWASMGELIQSVDIDEQGGRTTVSFGPPEQLTAEDLIERLRQARRNPPSFTFEDRDEPPEDALGGIAATPNSSSSRDGGTGGGAPECPLGDIMPAPESESGEWYILPSVVSGGGLTDVLGGVDGTLLTPTDGHYVWIEADISATVEEGVLTGGYEYTDFSLAQGASLPTSDEISADSATGTIIEPLGKWSDAGVWEKYGCGPVRFGFCSHNTVEGTASASRDGGGGGEA